MPSLPLDDPSPDGHTDPTLSWSDTISIAFSSCLSTTVASTSACIPCLHRAQSDDSLNNHGSSASHPPHLAGTINRIPRARPDELEGLLESDSDVERVSMHSNFGRGRKRANRKKNKKITLFGFDLFGKRRQAVPVKLTGEDDALYGVGQGEEEQTSAIPEASADGEGGDGKARAGEEGNSTTAITTPRKKRQDSRTPRSLSNTSSLFHPDPDAAPLSPSVIAELSQSIPPTPQTELESLPTSSKKSKSKSKKSSSSSSKDTRDKLERERLHLERLKQQGVLPEDAGGEEFEGFQGSGSMAPPAALGRLRSGSASSSSGSGSGSRSQSGTASRSGSGSRARSSSLRQIPRAVQEEEFGDFVDVPRDSVPSVPEEDEDAVDLDGGMYAGSGRSYAAKRASSRGSGSVLSDERSPTKDPLQRMHSRTGSSSASSSSRGGEGTRFAGQRSVPGTPLANEVSFDPLSTSQFAEVPMAKPKVKKSKSKSSRTTTSSRTSQSPSIASPISPSFADSPTIHVEQGLGFFDAEDMLPPATVLAKPPRRERAASRTGGSDAGSSGLGESERSKGFPSTGFGKARRATGASERDAVAFLGAKGDGSAGGI
ncbi:hypothetical protein DFP72DRAFT_508410 [Ephemerocybe angulata]|uniref:Uncharacterized protein n=1 Tax=Ephemerocybe angulata TaxID=980116 RepID=A0A8H6HQS6_9AGAR|nr:hypothetical protein DFP72DRAFT_508410 [Tulosesus angulatus]